MTNLKKDFRVHDSVTKEHAFYFLLSSSRWGQRVRACVSTRTLRDTGAILRVVRPCTSGYTFEPSCTTLQGAGAAELGVQLRPPQVRRVHLGKILASNFVSEVGRKQR